MEDFLINEGNGTPEKTEEMKFTKPSKSEEIEFIEYEVDRFDYSGYVVVRREYFSKLNCPAITVQYGKIRFNLKAIEKLGKCRHILILINTDKKRIIVKPCDEDDKDSLQWSRVDKHDKLVVRTITARPFCAILFKDMNWHLECTFKILGTLLTCKGEKMFVFDLMNAERYLSISKPTEDNPKRRERVAFIPQLWEKSYGQSYEESQKPIIETFEGMPEDYIKVTLPPLSRKKSASNKDKETLDLFSESDISSNTDQSNKSEGEVWKDETI